MNLIHAAPPDMLEMYKKVETMRDAKFIGEFAIKGFETHIPVFYNKVKHPRGSHYFGLYHTAWFPNILRPHSDEVGNWMICDAGSVEDYFWFGFEFGDGILYSRSRHDYREKDGYFIDGGRDYTRYGFPESGPKLPISFKIKDGEINVQLPPSKEPTKENV